MCVEPKKNIWHKRCGTERYTHFTCIALSSPPVFEIIEQEGQRVYIFELLFLTLVSSLPKIHEDYRSFFIASHLNLCVYTYINRNLMRVELNVPLQPVLYYKRTFFTSIKGLGTPQQSYAVTEFPSCLITLITCTSLAFISYIDEVPKFYRIRLSCVFYMLTCEVLLPSHGLRRGPNLNTSKIAAQSFILTR